MPRLSKVGAAALAAFADVLGGARIAVVARLAYHIGRSAAELGIAPVQRASIAIVAALVLARLALAVLAAIA